MSPDVRKVTIATLMPVTLRNSSAARFCVLPGAVVATFSLPGLARAALMKSWTDFSGEPALVKISRSKKPVVEVEAKSVRTLKGNASNSAVAMAVLLPVISTV